MILICWAKRLYSYDFTHLLWNDFLNCRILFLLISYHTVLFTVIDNCYHLSDISVCVQPRDDLWHGLEWRKRHSDRLSKLYPIPISPDHIGDVFYRFHQRYPSETPYFEKDRTKSSTGRQYFLKRSSWWFECKNYLYILGIIQFLGLELGHKDTLLNP